MSGDPPAAPTLHPEVRPVDVEGIAGRLRASGLVGAAEAADALLACAHVGRTVKAPFSATAREIALRGAVLHALRSVVQGCERVEAGLPASDPAVTWARAMLRVVRPEVALLEADA